MQTHTVTIHSSFPVPPPEGVPQVIRETECWRRSTLIVKCEIAQIATLSHDHPTRMKKAQERILTFLQAQFLPAENGQVRRYQHAAHLADWLGEIAGEYHQRYGHAETVADQLCELLIETEHFIRENILST